MMIRLFGALFLASLLMPSGADAQGPWRATLTQTLNPLPIPFCAAVRLDLFDPATGDVPRNPQGYRISIADFDIAVTTPDGFSAAAERTGPANWSACSCQGGVSGTIATVTATYPAQALAATARVKGVAFQRSTTFTVGQVKGPTNSASCAVLAPTSVAAGANASGAAVAAASGASGAGAAAGGAAGAAAVGGTAGPGVPAGGAALPGAASGGAAQAAAGGPVSGGAAPGAPAGVAGGAAAGAGAGGAAAGGGAAGAAPSGAAGAPGVTQPVGVVPGGATRGGTIATPAASAIVPVNPSGFTAVQTAPGQVQLSWQPVSGVAYYGLFGPGVASGGQQVMGGSTSFTATNVPSGNQSWTVGSFYLPGPVSTAFNAFPAASLNVTAPPVAAGPPAATTGPMSGQYLITITGMRAYFQSVDDLLSRDGMGDEVYAAAYVRRYDRKTGQLLESISRQSAAYGDVNKFQNQRIQAGTSSPTGGIRDGDMIPTGPMVAFRTLPAQSVTFPWKLWEGTLTDDSDLIVISPSVWEQDGSTAFYDEWVQQQAALNTSLFTNSTIQSQVSLKEFGMVVSGMSGTASGTVFDSQLRTALDMTLIQFGGGGLLTLLQTKSDRPIGLLANGIDAVMLPNRAVVLTREIIEAALAKPPAPEFPSPIPTSQLMVTRLPVINNRPGVMMLHFADSRLPSWNGIVSERPAIYQMFLQVESIP